MAARIRSHDWASTSLGPIERWPQSLRTAVDLMLDSAQPAYVAWGDELVFLYNDAFIPVAGPGHPASLGRPYHVVRAEVPGQHREAIEGVMAGRPCHVVDCPVPLHGRPGQPMSWFTLSWTPLRDESGQVAGLFCTAYETTQRVLAERSVRQSYETLLDTIDDGFCVIEVEFDSGGRAVDYRFLEANAAFTAHTGLRDVVGRRVRELVPGLEPFWFQAYGRVARTGRSERFEHRVEPLGRWYDVFASRFGEAGEHRVAILFKDVTRRKEDERALRASEKRMRDVLDSMGEGFALLGPDATILDVNRETLRLDGRARDELIGRSHWDAFPGSEDAPVGRLFRGVMRDREPGSLEHHYEWRDGRAMWIELRAYPTEEGGVAMFWRDASARRATDTALAESERRYRMLFDSMDEAYAVVDVLRDARGSWHDFRFVEVNDAFMRHTGMPYPVGRTATEMLGAPNPRWAQWYGQVIDGHGPLRIEEVEPVLGRTFDLNIFCLDRTRCRVAVLFTDITERKRTEAALRASEERTAFLLALGDAMRAQPDADGIIQVAARLLGERLGASRVLFAEFDHVQGIAHVFNGWFADGAQPFPEVMRLADYEGPILDDLRAGRIVRVRDTQDPQLARPDLVAIAGLGVAALLSIPLVVDDRLVVNLSVHQHRARAWTDEDVALAREVAERLWADLVRARAEAALRESEERQVFLLALSDALRLEATADGIAHRALTMLAGRLRLDRCYIAHYRLDDDRVDISYQTGTARTPPLPPSIRLSDFPEAFRIALERTLVIPDTTTYEPLSDLNRRSITALGLGSLVAASLRKGPGRPLWVLVALSADPRDWTAGEVSLIEDVAERTWTMMERSRVEASLGESEERLRRAAEVAKFALWDWDMRTGEVAWSDEHFRMQGYRVGEVAPSYAAWAARVHPDDLPGAEQALFAARDTRSEFMREFRSLHPDGTVHWLSARGRFFYDEAGEPVRMVGAMLDVTERREWEERQKVLVAELQHRTFNLMGVMRSTADAAIRRSASLDEFKARFGDRIAVLARVQRLLSKLQEDQRVTFDELIRGELESVGAFDIPGCVSLDGPDGVPLRSSGVQAFAMALHELATNAVKYGALKQPEARLEVRWRVQSDEAGSPWLHVDWRETGVQMPDCARPQGTGQGRELIEKALPYQLRARTEYRMRPDGVHCAIALPISGHRSGRAG